MGQFQQSSQFSLVSFSTAGRLPMRHCCMVCTSLRPPRLQRLWPIFLPYPSMRRFASSVVRPWATAQLPFGLHQLHKRRQRTRRRLRLNLHLELRPGNYHRTRRKVEQDGLRATRRLTLLVRQAGQVRRHLEDSERGDGRWLLHGEHLRSRLQRKPAQSHELGRSSPWVRKTRRETCKVDRLRSGQPT